MAALIGVQATAVRASFYLLLIFERKPETACGVCAIIPEIPSYFL
jgi:hypothetical protein